MLREFKLITIMLGIENMKCFRTEPLYLGKSKSKNLHSGSPQGTSWCPWQRPILNCPTDTTFCSGQAVFSSKSPLTIWTSFANVFR